MTRFLERELGLRLVPREDAVAREPALSEHAGGSPAADMPLVTWASSHVEQALVGQVEASELLRIADRDRSQD